MLYGPQPLWNDPSEIYPAINQSRQTARREYERKPGIIRIIKSIHDLSHTTNALLCLANIHFICRYGKRHQGSHQWWELTCLKLSDLLILHWQTIHKNISQLLYSYFIWKDMQILDGQQWNAMNGWTPDGWYFYLILEQERSIEHRTWISVWLTRKLVHVCDPANLVPITAVLYML